MKIRLAGEVKSALERMPIELLEKVYKLSLKEDDVKILQELLNYLAFIEKERIVSIAGSPKTQDELLENAMAQSFCRGKTSNAVTVYQIIKNSGEYAEKRIEEGKKNAR